jgi:hypothetical protein
MDPQQQHLAEILSLSPDARAVLDYLQYDLPAYPFDLDVDQPFVEELANDFPHIDLLEQVKLFRWYHDNHPPLHSRPRATLRRWIRGALAHPHR